MPEDMSANAPPRTIYSVSELNQAVRELLEHSFPLLWVEGEVSNLAQPRSGHWYFSLKDDQAQVRCAMFRNKNRLLRFVPENGTQILLRAKVSLYPARGDYQMIVEHMEEAGAGALQRAFEALKTRLGEEGLFDENRKQPIPTLPRRIGVITSATGAALRDVLSVLRRRFPLGQVLLHPVAVQGDSAAPAICRALATADRQQQCDVLLLVRGGGSLEDLWAFNEESVARAIRDCSIPIISGVGHETDVTIADFAADMRAPTPSAAAELVCPDQDAWTRQLERMQRQLRQSLARVLEAGSGRIENTSRRLYRLHPERRLQEQMQRLDEFEQRLRRQLQWQQQARQAQVQHLSRRLWTAHPGSVAEGLADKVQQLQSRLMASIQRRQEQASARWRVAARSLDAVSPLNTLERGYAIASTASGKILTSAESVQKGGHVQVTLRRGRLDCEVLEIQPETPDIPGETHDSHG